jgi:hypothetical protein
MNTERARRAAAVLAERGWSVTDNGGMTCPRCGADVQRNARYCCQCGEALRTLSHDTLSDLEAAIAAAMGDDELKAVLEALEYCLEDSAELLAERKAQWGQHRLDSQAAMAAALERHQKVAERLRQALRETKP